MKVYHGTSFSNACQILDTSLWVNRDERFLNEIYSMGVYKPMHDTILAWKSKGMLGNHFTTNVNHAASYANKNDKPVILFADIELESPCIDFIIPSIKTKYVKAYEGISDKISFYGSLLNAIYRRKKYVSKSTYGGILYGDSKKGIKRLADILKESINEVR